MLTPLNPDIIVLASFNGSADVPRRTHPVDPDITAGLLQGHVTIPSGRLKPPHVAQPSLIENPHRLREHGRACGAIPVLEFGPNRLSPIDVVQAMDRDFGARHGVEKSDELGMVANVHRALRQHASKIEALAQQGYVAPEPIGHRRYSPPVRRDKEG